MPGEYFSVRLKFEIYSNVNFPFVDIIEFTLGKKISRFCRESISGGFNFPISIGKYEKRALHFFQKSELEEAKRIFKINVEVPINVISQQKIQSGRTIIGILRDGKTN